MNIKNNNYFDFIVGTFVLISAFTFFFSSFRSSKVNNDHGYILNARFDNINGIANGSDVKISGVKIGSVINQKIDEKNFRAIIEFDVKDSLKLPVDSSAKIVSDGLLGGKYLEITPGSDEEILKEGEEIIFTQSSVNFEELLGKFMFNEKK
jgi:phospholipid/cholesterol/gamma-HCH transport system substrate-binding protein